MYLCTHNIYKVNKTELTLLNKIKTPEDLRKLNVDELPQLCDELRKDIVEEVAVNPGHLASSLKILTGRRERFCTNRKLGGIKPFPSPTESEYDTFACGHASNSISAALGMAIAAK